MLHSETVEKVASLELENGASVSLLTPQEDIDCDSLDANNDRRLRLKRRSRLKQVQASSSDGGQVTVKVTSAIIVSGDMAI